MFDSDSKQQSWSYNEAKGSFGESVYVETMNLEGGMFYVNRIGVAASNEFEKRERV